MAAQLAGWTARVRRAVPPGVAFALAAVIAAGGCSGPRPLSPASRSPVPAAGAATASPAATAPAAGKPVPPPGCSTVTAPGPVLTRVDTAMTAVPGRPFGIAESPDGRWTFAALTGTGNGGAGALAVFRNAATGAPVPARRVPVPRGLPLGVTISRDGRYLVAADELSGAAVISAGRAEQGTPGAVLGTLSMPGGQGGGAIEAAVTPDDRFVFVSLEASGELAVFSLRQALAHGFGPSAFAGTIPLGIAPVGLAISPDGRWLYATSEAGRPGTAGRAGSEGTLTVISVRRAETSPARSVVATVTAGCSPVRVITSADGQLVWVTARESNMLLGFSAGLLRSRPARALIAAVRVGMAPVGLALTSGGSRIVVAGSNRFGAPGATASLAVVSVPAALAGKPALLGYLRAGLFPREMALRPGGRTLYVGNFVSRQLETVSVTGLP